MKAHYRTANGRLTFELQAENVKDLFRDVAQVQEVFDAETKCGMCQSEKLKLNYREVDDYKFYELSCTMPECHARFMFGQTKKGGALFPKRKDENGHLLPNGGWSKYEPRAQEEDAQPRQQRPAGNGAAQPQTAAPSATPPANIPTFKTVEDAERSDKWGGPWLSVAGSIWRMGPKNAYEIYHAPAARP